MQCSDRLACRRAARLQPWLQPRAPPHAHRTLRWSRMATECAVRTALERSSSLCSSRFGIRLGRDRPIGIGLRARTRARARLIARLVRNAASPPFCVELDPPRSAARVVERAASQRDHQCPAAPTGCAAAIRGLTCERQRGRTAREAAKRMAVHCRAAPTRRGWSPHRATRAAAFSWPY